MEPHIKKIALQWRDNKDLVQCSWSTPNQLVYDDGTLFAPGLVSYEVMERNSELLEGLFKAVPDADIRPCDAASAVLQLWEILINEHTHEHLRLGSQKPCTLCCARPDSKNHFAACNQVKFCIP